MEKPTMVNMMGRDYSIEYVKTDDNMEARYCGRVIHAQQRIIVEDDKFWRDHLMHEIIHCIENCMKIEIKEEDVERMTVGMMFLFKYNQDVMKPYMEPIDE
jgi:hypothetical protein